MEKKVPEKQTVKDRIFHTFVELLKEKDCSRITATEMIEKSGVARASFYRNFKTIEDIIEYGIQKLTRQYHEGMTFENEDFHSRRVMLYKFQFYREHAELILALHHANISVTLLDLIVDCEIEACGDMLVSSISRYELYYFAGAFYNMMLQWLESGAKESPEAMADEFLRISRG